MNIKRFVSTVALLAVALPGTARADWGDPVSPSCAFTDVGTFDWGLNVTYLACLGAFDGNTNGAFAAGTLAKVNDAWGPGWTEGTAPTANDVTGVLTFSGFIQGAFAIALKQGNAFSLYLFNATAPINTMKYTTAGVQAGATTEIDISHGNLYTRVGVGGTCFGDACGSVVTPEPSTYALMAAGLAAVAFVTRRRRRIV